MKKNKEKADIRDIFGAWGELGWGKMKVLYEPNKYTSIVFYPEDTDQKIVLDQPLYKKHIKK